MGSPSESPAPSLELTPVPGLTGGRFGRYRLCFELASGGMGAVYLARADGPASFEKLVALKRIHEHLAKDPRFVAMFLDEARIAARLHHPNVCSVIDFGAVNGSYYLTMPFVVGEPLHRIVRALQRRGDAALAKRFWYVAARIVADACEGLHAAHELRGDDGEMLDVVHRDVSPQNLLIGYDGSARVLDFGVASARHRLHSTATGEVKGKFAYIAPEQLEGLAVDRRADVWSLGVVLYECIALRRLFGRKTMAETVHAVVNLTVPALSEYVPDVPLALEEIVFKALARDPARRYESARAMGRDLLAFLTEERQVVGPAEVGDLLECLFPDGRAAQERLIDRARAGEAVDALLASRADEEPVDEEPVDEEASDETASDEVSLDIELASPTPPTRSVESGAVEPAASPPAREGRKVWPIVLAVLMAMGIGAGLTAWALEEPTAGAEQAEAAPAATAPTDSAEASAPGPAEAADSEPAPAEAADSTEAESDEADPAEAESSEPDSIEGADDSAPARARSRGEGTVTIVTPGGWALVYRGRARLGEAPGTFRLPAGRHTLGVQPFGRGDIQRRRVRVRRDETLRLSIPVR